MRKIFGISRYILAAAFLLMSFGVVMLAGEVSAVGEECSGGPGKGTCVDGEYCTVNSLGTASCSECLGDSNCSSPDACLEIPADYPKLAYDACVECSPGLVSCLGDLRCNDEYACQEVACAPADGERPAVACDDSKVCKEETSIFNNKCVECLDTENDDTGYNPGCEVYETCTNSSCIEVSAESCSELLDGESTITFDVSPMDWYINTSSQGSAIDVCGEFTDCISMVCGECSNYDGMENNAYVDYMENQSSMIKGMGGPNITNSMGYQDVMALQQFLNNSCNSSVPIDCKFGLNTIMALSDCDYCNDNGLNAKTFLKDSDGLMYSHVGCEEGYIENRDNPYCCEMCIPPKSDGTCDAETDIVVDGCCICASPTTSNDLECVVETTDCIDGTVNNGKCDVNITDNNGTTKTVSDVKIVDSDGDSSDGDCSKGGTLTGGQSCCDGYKKIKNDDGTKTCKECGTPGVCCGVSLNTNVPFIGDCIQFQKSASDPNTTVVGPTTAFPKLMQGLSKLMVTAILVFSFVLLIVAGVMMAAGGADESAYSTGKKLIGKVIVGIALLGASGVILKLINPNFFG